MSWQRHLFPVINTLAQNHWLTGRLRPCCRAYDHKLILIHRGSCLIRTQNQEQHYREGSFLIIPAGAHHAVTIEEDCTRTIIHFDWSPRSRPLSPPWNIEAGGSFDQQQITPTPRWVPQLSAQHNSQYKSKHKQANQGLHGDIPPGRALALAEFLVEDWNAEQRDHERCNSLLASLLIHLLASPATSAKSHTHNEQLARRVCDTLEQAPELDLPMAQRLADLPGSQEHLSRIFKTYYGISPLQYVLALRIELARQLLTQSNQAVAAIAQQVGFATPAYFAKTFKRIVGTTPDRYRKEL